MSVAATGAVLLAALAGLVGPRGSPGLRRVARWGDLGVPTAAGRAPVAVPRWVPSGLAVVAAVVLTAGHGAVAVVLLVLAALLGGPNAHRRRHEREHTARLARDLPRAADLLAACLDAGATPAAALAEVARAVSGPVGDRLGQLAALLATGAELTAPPPDVAAGGDPVDRLTRALSRAARSGAPLAATVRGLADDERARHRAAAAERARAAGVRATGPLAICFLPAFVLVGVVPVVVGIAQRLVAVTS